MTDTLTALAALAAVGTFLLQFFDRYEFRRRRARTVRRSRSRESGSRKM